MSNNFDTAEAIVSAASANDAPVGMPSAGMVLLSPAASWLLASAEVCQPKGLLATEAARVAAMQNAFAQQFPGPATSALSVDQVVGAFEMVCPQGQDMILAVDKLSQLNWPDRREALRRLGTRGPTLGGMPWLGVLQSALDALPNVEMALRAAWLATKFACGTRIVDASDVSQWLDLCNALLALQGGEMAEVLLCLDIPPESVEGALSLVTADIDEELVKLAPTIFAGAITGPPWFRNLMNAVKDFDRSRTDFKEFLKSDKQWYGYYIGLAVHVEIAAWYRAQHAHAVTAPGGGLWSNTTPVETIFNAVAGYYGGTNAPISRLGRAYALSRPDIYELSFIHGQPPGWVYEIKAAGPTAEGLVQAEREAIAYAALLNVWSMPAQLGPAGATGTAGSVPAPGGWVCFVSPIPGAIVYRYIKAPDEAYRRKFPRTADARKRRTAELRAKLPYQVPVAYPNTQPFPAEFLLVAAAGLLILLTDGVAAAPLAEAGALQGLRWVLAPALAL